MNVWLDQSTWVDLSIALGIVVGAWLVGWMLTRLFGRLLLKLVRRSRTEADDLVVEVLMRHVPLWFGLAGGLFAARFVGAAPGLVRSVDRVGLALLILSLSFGTAAVVSGFLARRVIPVGGAGATTLTRKLVRSAIVLIGMLVALNSLGLDITPVVTALGVGSLAVGLALQPTLSNFFAGVNLTMARRIRVGDYIRLDSGQEGHVQDIGWRSTQIHDNANNVILVPNAKLVDLIVTNASLVESEVNFPVSVGVGYDSDLEHVERVALEVARAVQKDLGGAVAGWEPLLRFTDFGESAVGMDVVLRARTFPDRALVMHEFIKRIHARFDREGIDIPFPQRVVQVRGAGVEAEIDAPAAGPR